MTRTAFLFAGVFLLLATPGIAQQSMAGATLGKGSIGLGGVASFDVINRPGQSNQTFGQISPRADFFVSTNTALFASLSYSGNRNENTVFPIIFPPISPIAFISETNLYGVSFGVTRYKFFGGKFGIAGTFSASFNFGTRREEQVPLISPGATASLTDITQLGIFIAPSLVYEVSDRWLLTASFGRLSYLWNQEKLREPILISQPIPTPTETSTLSLSLQSGLGLGFVYFLRRRY